MINNIVVNIDLIVNGIYLLIILCFYHLLLVEYHKVRDTYYRFKLHALRDRLKMLVVDKKIDNSSIQYKALIHALN